MVTPCINNIHHFIFQLTHTTLKNDKLLKHFKIRKLLQHVSVYKETIIREPQLWLPDDGFLVNRNILEQFPVAP